MIIFTRVLKGHATITLFLLEVSNIRHNIHVSIYTGQDGASALWIACQMGHAGCVKELLEASAEVDTTREVGMYNGKRQVYHSFIIKGASRVV